MNPLLGDPLAPADGELVILVLEDEAIIAMDLEGSLTDSGVSPSWSPQVAKKQRTI